MNALFIFFLMLSSGLTHATECASTVQELKHLVGDEDLPLAWIENSPKNTLTLKLLEESGTLVVNLTAPKGQWARVKGQICKQNQETYVARVEKITWGEAAPWIARGKRIKELKLRLPYPSLLVVSVSFLSFEFSPQE